MAGTVISLALGTLIIDIELDILAADILRHNLVALLRARSVKKLLLLLLLGF